FAVGQRANVLLSRRAVGRLVEAHDTTKQVACGIVISPAGCEAEAGLGEAVDDGIRQRWSIRRNRSKRTPFVRLVSNACDNLFFSQRPKHGVRIHHSVPSMSARLRAASACPIPARYAARETGSPPLSS